MKTKNAIRGIIIGAALVLLFVIWTVLIKTVDVQPVGQNGTNIGFSALNVWFHGLTGVHMSIYNITDWLGLVPFFTCICFGLFGLIQLIKRKSLKKVDTDIILLGVYYVIVIAAYFFFEKFPINYRPILIEGIMEASYPSSTTLLVMSVMPTLIFQLNRRSDNKTLKTLISAIVVLFSAFMVIGRLIAGVHWITDIIGGLLLSVGLYIVYSSVVELLDEKKEKQ